MRHLTRLAAAIAVFSALATTQARAQLNTNNGLLNNDPFSLYYGFFLPRQAALANQPGPEATINAAVAARQSYAETTRGGLYDPSSPFLADEDEFVPDGGRRKGGSRVARLSQRTTPHAPPNTGAGPASYYSRGLTTYYPNQRVGRGKNMNVAVTRAPGRGAGVPSAASLGGGNFNTGPR